MRRPFTTSFIVLALVVGAAGATPAAHAEANKNGENCFVNADCVSNYCSPEGIDQNTCKANAAASSVTPTPPMLPPPSNRPITKRTVASHWHRHDLDHVALRLAPRRRGAYAQLRRALYRRHNGDYVNNLSAVGVTWRILRDLGNIIIIFGFLAIGITTILNVNWYGGKMKMLPMLLVSAVFLNFSLFITEAVIDTGNLFATQFYTQINGGVSPTRKHCLA